MCRNNRGFTLIEVFIAMFILLIGMLALLNTAAVVIQNNLKNVIRDEAVTVAEAAMSDIKNTPFANIASQQTYTVKRYIRGIETDFSVTPTVPPAVGTTNTTKTVTVLVQWAYQGTLYQHSITTVINNS